MKRKNVGNILVFLGSLSLSGCQSEAKHSEYDFKGYIGGDMVMFHRDEIFGDDKNYLEIVRRDGVKILASDLEGNDLRFDLVEVFGIDGGRFSYRLEGKDEPIMVGLRQSDFDVYLSRILEEKNR